MNQQDFITIARIVKTQGRHGEVAAEILTDFPERFAERKRLVLKDPAQSKQRELELEDFWLHKGQIVLKFAGVNSISEAEALAGCEVQIRRSERAELEAGTFYSSDLIGSSLWDHTSQPPRPVGTVEAVEGGAGSAPLLNVRSGADEIQIPFAEEYIVSVDLAAKRIDVKLPEGLLKINQPLTEEEKQRLNRKRQDEV